MRVPAALRAANSHNFWFSFWGALHTGFSVRNTAIGDAKLLGQIIGAAVQRGMIRANPIRKLGIAKIPPAEKREITDEEIERCIAELQNEPDWMRLAFMVGLHTGCRLSETSLTMKLVDFKHCTITFPYPKGVLKLLGDQN